MAYGQTLVSILLEPQLMNSADNRHPQKVLKRAETFQQCFSYEVDLTVTVFIRFVVDIHTVPAFLEDL